MHFFERGVSISCQLLGFSFSLFVLFFKCFLLFSLCFALVFPQLPRGLRVHCFAGSAALAMLRRARCLGWECFFKEVALAGCVFEDVLFKTFLV